MRFFRKKIWLVIILFFTGVIVLFSLKTSFTINQVTGQDKSQQDSFSSEDKPQLPEKDPDRVNILLLGIRGLEDPGEGKLLSDAIVVLSIKKEESGKNKIALISLPRDLYVDLWCAEAAGGGKHKINFAYVYGGLDCAAKTVSLVTGLYIDQAVSINFEGLKNAIDALGGITIYRDTYFEETVQWARDGKEENRYWQIRKFTTEEGEEERWVFRVPQGENTLDGETALYYVRSRYSSNDFDRMRRQHQVLMAVKDKALSLGVLLNPVKIYNILDVVGKNVRTDMGLGEIKDFIGLISDADIENIRTKIFDTSPQGLLYHTFINEEYVLLPTEDNFDKIKEACLNIFR